MASPARLPSPSAPTSRSTASSPRPPPPPPPPPPALPPPPACLQPQPTATTPASAPKPPTPAEPLPPLPTSEDFRRAAEAARIAAEDAYIIPRLTKRQRDLIRAYCALPDPLPDGDDDDAWT